MVLQTNRYVGGNSRHCHIEQAGGARDVTEEYRSLGIRALESRCIGRWSRG